MQYIQVAPLTPDTKLIVVISRASAIQSSYNLLALIALSILSSSGAQIFQKLAATSSRQNTSLLTNWHFIVSLALLGIGLGFWLMVLARMDVSLAYPLLSLNYIVVLLIARFYFGEPIPVHRWIGTLIILAGIVLLLGSNVK